MSNQRADAFWGDLAEISARTQLVQQEYLQSRDALLAHYGRSQSPELDELWQRYRDCVEQLRQAIAELHQYVTEGRGR